MFYIRILHQQDWNMMQKIYSLSWITLRRGSHFSRESCHLRCLSSGFIGDGSVNVDSARTIGTSIKRSVEGLSIAKHKFTKKVQVINLATSLYVSIEGEKIEIAPQQLYQHLLVASMGNIDLQTLFQYELCSYPSSLSDKRLFMRLADKAELQNGLVKKIPTCVTKEKLVDSAHVVDGGALLQHLPWPKSTSYADICQLCIQHVHKHYYNALIVFDGYNGGPTTKDKTHQRRTSNEIGIEVYFILDMLLRMKKK